MTDLFTPMNLNGLSLPNRIWMSAMTRTRATPDNVPTSLMAEYFAQRAAAGLIVTECTAVSEQGKGVINGPGIWRDDQISGWRNVTDAVHAARRAHLLPVVALRTRCPPRHAQRHVTRRPIAIASGRQIQVSRSGGRFTVPRELAADEIPPIIADFAQATRNAREAGFDGVELHAANGYLHDQFLQDVTNKRTDDWGGPVENRCRLILETIDAMAQAWSMERVGIRLGPSISLYGMGDSYPLATFGLVVRELDRRRWVI